VRPVPFFLPLVAEVLGADGLVQHSLHILHFQSDGEWRLLPLLLVANPDPVLLAQFYEGVGALGEPKFDEVVQFDVMLVQVRLVPALLLPRQDLSSQVGLTLNVQDELLQGGFVL